jgi:chromate reductase
MAGSLEYTGSRGGQPRGCPGSPRQQCENADVRVIAISGSLRAVSSNASLLRAAARISPTGMEIELFEGVGSLPHFNADLDGEGDTPPESVRRFRELLLAADGVLISSPEYAHGVPGSFKNALDWLVSVGALVGTPVLLMNAAPNGGDHAQAAIVETLRTMNWRVLEQASLLRPFLRHKLGPEGNLTDEAAVTAIRESLQSLAGAIRSRRVAARERQGLRAEPGEA